MNLVTPSTYYVYLISCSDNSIYTGITNDIEKRIKQHNGVVKGGAKYTRTRRPVKILYFEKFETKSDALKREFQIKKLKKEDKLNLISKS